VLSPAGLHVFAVNGDLRRAGEAPPKVIPVPRGKLEGVCFAPDGLVLTAESRQVYFIKE